MRYFKDWKVRALEKKVPGLWGDIMGRKCYIDEKVVEDSAGQVEAVVNIGAGFDTRIYRLSALTEVPVWEVDQQENIDAKQSRLKKVFQEFPAYDDPGAD